MIKSAKAKFMKSKTSTLRKSKGCTKSMDALTETPLLLFIDLDLNSFLFDENKGLTKNFIDDI